MNNIMGRYLKIGDSRIYYTIAGEGEPLIFIHGNFNDSRVWEYQIESFASHYKVICYDQRGYGNSDTPTNTFSHYEDLKALIDSLVIKKVTLVGSSSGGGVAVDFALQYPHLVKALILVAPSINGYPYPMRVMMEAMKNISLLKSKGFEASIETFISKPYWSYLIPSQQNQEAREMVLQIIRTPKNYYSWNFKLARPLKPYANKRLGEIKLPTLIVLSPNDKAFNIKAGEHICKNIKTSKKELISDCGHIPFIEKPDEFNQRVLDFLNHELD